MVFLLTVYISNRVMLRSEKEFLAGLGYVNPIMLDDGRQINVIERGSGSPKHTIVVLTGLGMSDTGVTMGEDACRILR